MQDTIRQKAAPFPSRHRENKLRRPADFYGHSIFFVIFIY